MIIESNEFLVKHCMNKNLGIPFELILRNHSSLIRLNRYLMKVHSENYEVRWYRVFITSFYKGVFFYLEKEIKYGLQRNSSYAQNGI